MPLPIKLIPTDSSVLSPRNKLPLRLAGALRVVGELPRAGKVYGPLPNWICMALGLAKPPTSSNVAPRNVATPPDTAIPLQKPPIPPVVPGANSGPTKTFPWLLSNPPLRENPKSPKIPIDPLKRSNPAEPVTLTTIGSARAMAGRASSPMTRVTTMAVRNARRISGPPVC